MRPGAILSRKAAVVLCVAGLFPQTWAGNTDAQLGVAVMVRPTSPAVRALATLPLPPGARAMTANRFGASYHYDGAIGEAVDYYHAAMARLGYRLSAGHQTAAAATLVWERSGERVELRFDQALGTLPATRIVVTASATNAS